jgi:hypothetical protein
LQPGSSAQILVGLVIALAFFTILLRSQPYVEEDDDKLQSIATGSTVMTLLIGFTLKINEQNQNNGTVGGYDIAFMDVILVGLFLLVSVSGVYITLKTLPCCGCCCARSGGNKGQKNNRKKPKSTVVPQQEHHSGQREKSELKAEIVALKWKKNVHQAMRSKTKNNSNANAVGGDGGGGGGGGPKLKKINSRMHHLLKKAIVHNDVASVIETASSAAEKHKEKVIKRQESAGVRLEKRLSRRKITPTTTTAASRSSDGRMKQNTVEKQVGEKNTGTKVVPITSDFASEIATVRSLLKTKSRSRNKFQMIFNKVDQDNNGALSMKEFKVLVQLTVRGNKEFSDTLNVYFKALWTDLCQKCVNQNGGGEVEVDVNTATNWVFGSGGTADSIHVDA